MSRHFGLKLTHAQLRNLRDLVLTHADSRKHGWAELTQMLDDLCIEAANYERTYGASDQKDFIEFNKEIAV